MPCAPLRDSRAQEMGVQGIGEHEFQLYSGQSGDGVAKCTLSYFERRIGDSKELMDLAQWRRLAKSL
jgi:hypothetical protein